MQPTQGIFSKGIVWLACELVIVFTGVMLAFFVSGWQADRLIHKRAVRTLKILDSELSDYVRYGPIPQAKMVAELDTFQMAMKAGQLPLPAYYREPRAATSPVEAWHAVVQSGAYELLDDSLFYALSLHYNRVIHFNDRFMRYTLQTEQIIMPYIDEPAAFFYDAGSSRLKSEYKWHVRQLKELIDELSLLLEEAATLSGRLESQLDSFE